MIKTLILILFLVSPVMADKRYYFSPVVGSGVRGDSYRAHIATVPANSGDLTNFVIPVSSTGIPLFNWGLLIVTAADQTPYINDSFLKGIPPVSLDSSTSSFTAPQVTAITNALTNHNVPTTIFTGVSTVRQFIRGLGRFLDSNFDENQN